MTCNLFFPIALSNTVDLPPWLDAHRLTDALYVGVTGDVAVVQANNVVTVFPAVPAGTTLWLQARRVNATGTTSTAVVAQYASR